MNARIQPLALALLATCLWSPAGDAAQTQDAAIDPAAAGAPLSPYAFAWDPRTGDAWLDRQLTDINTYGDRYRGAFVDELVRYHAAPRALAVELISKRGWAPGNVYFACALAQVVGRPCRALVGDWEQGHADGWEAMSKRLGADDGATRARLQQAIRDSFVRWGRPLAQVPPAPPEGGAGHPAGEPHPRKRSGKRSGK